MSTKFCPTFWDASLKKKPYIFLKNDSKLCSLLFLICHGWEMRGKREWHKNIFWHLNFPSSQMVSKRKTHGKRGIPNFFAGKFQKVWPFISCILIGVRLKNKSFFFQQFQTIMYTMWKFKNFSFAKLGSMRERKC